jgi:hypothetical protein
MGGHGSGHRISTLDKGTLLESIIAIADADTDADYRLAWWRFWKVLYRLGFNRQCKKTATRPGSITGNALNQARSRSDPVRCSRPRDRSTVG